MYTVDLEYVDIGSKSETQDSGTDGKMIIVCSKQLSLSTRTPCFSWPMDDRIVLFCFVCLE